MTVTDAHVVLGRVDSGHFLGGRMSLDAEAARLAVMKLGDQMSLGTEEAALGILKVANSNIDRAIRRVTIARGHDPRGFTLVAFGGAGPLHACAVAEQLEIPRVLVPLHSGVLCAFGLLVADVVLEQSQTVLEPVGPGTPALIRERLRDMVAGARFDLITEGIQTGAIVLDELVDVRYRGQAYELTIPFEDDIAAAFHAAHAAAYGHAMVDRAVEVVNVRVHATGLVDPPRVSAGPQEESDGGDAYIGEKIGYVRGRGGVPLELYERDRFTPGTCISGPALVFQMDSTTFVPPHWHLRVDEYRNLILEARPETRWCESISVKRPTSNAEQAQNRAGAPRGGNNRRLDGLDDPPPGTERGYRPGL